MKKILVQTVCYIITIALILLLAACGSPQATGQQSTAPINTPTATSATITVPTDENVDRCGFNMAYGTMVTDGKYIYYRRYGGEEQGWDIQRMDLTTKEVKTLVSSDTYDAADHAVNLFLDGGKLYFTLAKASTEELYSYDDTAGTATKITEAKTILLAQGTIYLIDGGKLFSQPVAGGSRKQLLDKEPLDMAISPTFGAFLTDQNKIILLKKDGTKQELDATLPEDKGKASASYYWDKANPDNFGQVRIYSGALYYIANAPGPDGSGERLSMSRLDMASGSAEKIFSVDENFNITGFTVFAGKIFYTSAEIPEELGSQVTIHLYQYDLNTGENRQLSQSQAAKTGSGDTEFNAITLTGPYAFAWLLTKTIDTGAGASDTYTLYRVDTASGAGEKLDQYDYQYFYNGPPDTSTPNEND